MLNLRCLTGIRILAPGASEEKYGIVDGWIHIGLTDSFQKEHDVIRWYLYVGFLKWWVSPTTMGFPTKNDHFGVEIGGTTI